MGIFATKKEVETQDSLSVAYGQLLEKFGMKNKGIKIDADASWTAISEKYPQLQVLEVGFYGTWPTSNDSIIQFQYQPPDAPYIQVDGENKANIVNLFCLCGDYQDRTIIDPLDGQVKAPGIYGVPFSWARFGTSAQTSAEPPDDEPPGKPGSRYTLLKGETLWSVAKKLGLKSKELIEHNGVDDPNTIQEGFTLHLPFARPPEQEPLIEYEILDKPRPMHISFEGGTKKFSFSNTKDWRDVKTTGPTYPENANVDIVAIARVPIQNEVGTFYMDNTALGNYSETGRVQFTIGFNHTHLADGYVEKPKPVVKPVVKAALQKSKDQPEPGVATLPTTELDMSEPDPDVDPNIWKTTYVSLDKPHKYVSNEAMWIHDLDGKRPDRELFKNQDVFVAGTFIKDDVLYGRPTGAVKNALWYGVPMSNLIDEDELYNTEVSLAERTVMSHGRLSLTEQYVTVPLSRLLSQGVRVKTWFNKTKTRS